MVIQVFFSEFYQKGSMLGDYTNKTELLSNAGLKGNLLRSFYKFDWCLFNFRSHFLPIVYKCHLRCCYKRTTYLGYLVGVCYVCELDNAFSISYIHIYSREIQWHLHNNHNVSPHEIQWHMQNGHNVSLRETSGTCTMTIMSCHV